MNEPRNHSADITPGDKITLDQAMEVYRAALDKTTAPIISTAPGGVQGKRNILVCAVAFDTDQDLWKGLGRVMFNFLSDNGIDPKAWERAQKGGT